jgi:hypothetical protein
MKRPIFIALAALVLSGCAEYEARKQAAAQAQAAAIDTDEDGVCRSYGAVPGTTAYIQCRMNISNQRAQVAANDRAIALQYLLRR